MKIWTNDISDLGLLIHKIHYAGKNIKFRATLVNKYNGIVYENKNYKMSKKKFDMLYQVDIK